MAYITRENFKVFQDVFEDHLKSYNNFMNKIEMLEKKNIKLELELRKHKETNENLKLELHNLNVRTKN